ncbi:hypothetical protein AYO38_00725 [bacterium SCGC AG-212-C10]|nr:hypothetical protein AYO38_00725 [bacterium SCGC AG-212-C10]
MRRRAKIVCTLGPASAAPAVIAQMIDAGMDVARLNTSHGSLDDHIATVKRVREVAAVAGKHIGVLMDLSGPKLRTGPRPHGPLSLIEGHTVEVTTDIAAAGGDRVFVPYAGLVDEVGPGERVLLDDGNIALRVESREGSDSLRCRIEHGGELQANKGIAFPDSELALGALTERDERAIAAGVAAGVDFFALSFVSNVADLERARHLISQRGADTPIIAKIERRVALNSLDELLIEADGAMVARGDLGVELPPEEVPWQQRRIIDASARALIPVITATQMLESMIQSPRPTRAESSDVANAVWDLSDALMLSGETAVGRYPVETVRMMDRIISRAEAAPDAFRGISATPLNDDHSYVIALAAKRIVERDANMRAVVCFTRSGHTATLMSKVHPEAPIFAVSPTEAICRRLSLARSVIPLHGALVETSEEMLQMVDELLVRDGHLAVGDEVVVVASLPVRAVGATNFLKLHRIGESVSYQR